jgi:hypothetical protein
MPILWRGDLDAAVATVNNALDQGHGREPQVISSGYNVRIEVATWLGRYDAAAWRGRRASPPSMAATSRAA